jgi:uncharacterized membrane protein
MVVLAALNSTGYKIVLMIHVLAVIVGFAPLWLAPVLVRLTAAGDKAAADGLEVSILRFSLPGIGIAGILGFALAGMSEKAYKMSQAWLSISAVLWVVLLALLFTVARPAIKAFRDGDAAARSRIMIATGISHIILVVTLYFMIFKPGA